MAEVVEESSMPVNTEGYLRIDRKLLKVGNAEVVRYVYRHKPVVFVMVHARAIDRYLVTKEYRVGVGGVTYGFPAGMVEDGEDPKQAAMRELHEETGIQFIRGSIDELGTVYTSEGFTDEKATCFVVELDKFRVTDTDFDLGEFVESEWVSEKELLEMVSDGRITSAVAVGMVYRYLYDKKSK